MQGEGKLGCTALAANKRSAGARAAQRAHRAGRRCSGAQTRRRDWRASERSAGRGDGWGCDKSAQAANNNSERAQTGAVRTRAQAGRRAGTVEQRRMRFKKGPGSLWELGRGSLAEVAAIGSATQGTRWVVQVRESCLREGKSERDWGKSETGGGGEKYSSCFWCQWPSARGPAQPADHTPAVVAGDGGRATA